MFGLIYSLFASLACTIDNIKKDLENKNAIQQSKQKGNWVIGRGKTYYNGIEAHVLGADTPTSHYIIMDKRGKIIKDITQESYDKSETKDEMEFYNTMVKARENGKYYFERSEHTFFYSDGNFKENTPNGFYEVDTLKRFHTMTDQNGKHYKMYDKKYYNADYSIGSKWFVYVPDKENKIAISETEWEKLGGEKNQIENNGKILFDSPGNKYTYTIVRVPFDNKKRGKK